MDNNEQRVYGMDGEENEISLVSLFSALLRSWRSLLIWGVVFCLLGAAYQAYRSRGSAEAMEKAVTEYNRQLANYEQEVNVYERERASILADIEGVYDYVENSVLLKIDPYEEAYASADLLFESDEDIYSVVLSDKLSLKNGNASRILGMYTSFLDNTISYEELAGKYGTDEALIRELVGYNAIPENNSLRIFVRHTDQADAEAIMDYVLEKIAEQKESYEGEVPEHNYTVINKGVRKRVDYSMMASVEELKSGTNVAKRVNSLYSTQLAKIEEFNTRIKEIDDKLKSIVRPMSVEAGNQRGILKFALIGFLGGLVLGVIFRILRLFMSGKLLDRQPLMLRFGLRLLAAFPHGKSDIFNRLADRMLVAEKGLTQDEVQTVAVNSIRRVVKDQKHSILIAAGREMKENWCRALQEGLSQKDPGNTYVLVPAFGNNLHTQQALESCDYVVMTAEIANTRQETIANMLSITEQYGKQILGVILYN